MTRETLLEFFDERIRSDAEFLVYVNQYRVQRYSYAVVRQRAVEFAARLTKAGINPGDKVLFWGENRPEWLLSLIHISEPTRPY